jgi:hypothetical protein
MILCTGNPIHPTVASAIKKIFPHCEFASRATGYDLRFWDPGSEDHFKQQIKNYNVFINSSFICDYGQMTLLETAHEVWSVNQIKGHIFNVGSVSEHLGLDVTDSLYARYSIQKRALRDRSLQLNGKNGIKTTHITAGGLNDGKPEHKEWLDLTHIAQTIQWILMHPCEIPLIEIQAHINK